MVYSVVELQRLLWLLRPILERQAAFSLSTGLLSSSLAPQCLLLQQASRVCSYSLPACWVDVACIQVSFTNVFVAKERPSCWSGACCELAKQHVLRDAIINHAPEVSEPAQASLSQQSEHARNSCLLQDCLVCDAVLTGDDQNPETAHVEGVEAALLPRIQCPRFTAIEQRDEHVMIR